MSLENSAAHIEHQEQVKMKVASPEEIAKVEESIEYSNKLVRANDVLKVLDFPDNQEEGYRRLLLTKDDATLDALAKKSKEEILVFLVQEKKNELLSSVTTQQVEKKKTVQTETQESEKQNIKAARIERKIVKIRAVFPMSILANNPDIAEKFRDIDSKKTPEEKEEVLKEMLNLLKEPGRLRSITDELG